MYAHQKHIIKEFVSTALISDDPHDMLETALIEAFDCIASDADQHHLLDFLYKLDETAPLENLGK